MNREQKIAWFMIVVIATSLVMSVVAVTVLYFIVGMPRDLDGFSCLGISGFAGFARLIFKKEKGVVEFDERIQIIRARAAAVAFSSMFSVTIISCISAFFIYGSEGMIPIKMLTIFVGVVAITLFFIYSLAIVIQYGRDSIDGGEKNERE